MKIFHVSAITDGACIFRQDIAAESEEAAIAIAEPQVAQIWTPRANAKPTWFVDGQRWRKPDPKRRHPLTRFFDKDGNELI